MQLQPLAPNTRYFLFLIRCATHQSGLSAKSGIIGSIATVFGTCLHEAVTGVCVRLFKYVVNDYYEEFCIRVRDWVSETLEVVGAHEANHVGRLEAIGSKEQRAATNTN